MTRLRVFSDLQTEIDGGANHTCARTSTNELYCWGSGSTGELDSGRVVHLGAFPVRVVDPESHARLEDRLRIGVANS